MATTALVLAFTYYTTEGEEDQEHTHEFPARYRVCPRCDGKGTHVNPSIDGHGISAEEWERDWDPEERENYFAGVYDVGCYECDGKRVVLEHDTARFSEEDKRVFEIYKADARDRAAHEAECAAERAMGA